MVKFQDVKAVLVEALVENVEDHTIAENDIQPILMNLAKITQDRPLDSWKQLVQKEIENHETGHARSKPANVKKNNKNSCPYPAQYKHTEACTAYHEALGKHKGVLDAKKAMYNAVAAAAAAGGGKTRRSKNKKTRKAKRRA
jgi:hypothetical protein